MTIHPVVTASSRAANTAASITGLLLHVILGQLLFVALPVTVSGLPVPTVVDITLVCVDCRQFVGVMIEYSVMTVVVVGDDGAGGAWDTVRVAVTLTVIQDSSESEG